MCVCMGEILRKVGCFFIRETVEDCGEFFGNGCSLLNYGRRRFRFCWRKLLRSLQSLSGWFR